MTQCPQGHICEVSRVGTNGDEQPAICPICGSSIGNTSPSSVAETIDLDELPPLPAATLSPVDGLSDLAVPKDQLDHSTTSRAKIAFESTDVIDGISDRAHDSKSDNSKRCEFDRVGRYKLTQLLGWGGFADVYLALDEELERSVAVKISRPRYRKGWEERDAYLGEARTAAKLDHPYVVPVYDIGQTEDGRVYVVSKYIRGSDLAKVLQESPPTYEQSASLVAKVADGLHHAHRKGLVHRDIKPANILLDVDGTPCVADFGLALHEDQQRTRAGEFAGTMPYMSPEQVRGEVHRLDGRVDIWALGVILYEMLTGRRPFAGEDTDELFDEILHRDPKPLRQIDDDIPIQLERVTLKCLSKKPTDRYTTCLDIANDLTAWLECSEVKPGREAEPEPPLEPPEEKVSLAVRALRRSRALRLAALLFSGIAPNLFLTVILLLYYKVMLGYGLDGQVPLWVNSICYGAAIVAGLALGWRIVFKSDTAEGSASEKLLRQCLTLPIWMSCVSFILWFIGAGMVAKFGDGDQLAKVYLSFVGANFLAGSIAASLVFYFLSWVSLNALQARQINRQSSKTLQLLLTMCKVYQYGLGAAPVAMALVLFLGYEKTDKSSLLRYIVVVSIVFVAVCFVTIIAILPRIKSRILLLTESSKR